MKYYVCANTADGAVDFTEDNIFDIENKILLKGENDFVRSLVLDYSGVCTLNSEKILSVGSRDLTNGIISRDNNTAIISKCNNPSKVIDLGEFFDSDGYNCEEKYLYEKMFGCYRQAKEIHDEWEKLYIDNMDFSRLDKYCNGIIEKLVTSKSVSGSGKTYKRFFGTTTVNGAVNHIDSISGGLLKRYFIKGRPGTGKSTFLKKLSKKLTENGFDVEEYYCSFDKNSLDMVASGELSFCVFDSTAPHEKFPQRESDEILDFYVEAGLSGVDEKYHKELFFVKSAYDLKIREGKEFFVKAYTIKEEANKRMLTKINESQLRKFAKSIAE